MHTNIPYHIRSPVGFPGVCGPRGVCVFGVACCGAEVSEELAKPRKCPGPRRTGRTPAVCQRLRTGLPWAAGEGGRPARDNCRLGLRRCALWERRGRPRRCSHRCPLSGLCPKERRSSWETFSPTLGTSLGLGRQAATKKLTSGLDSSASAAGSSGPRQEASRRTHPRHNGRPPGGTWC